jgi:hypothetical protein
VIGLHLCPFAERAYRRDQIRYRVSLQSSPAGIAQDLVDELDVLREADPLKIETSLLIHPRALCNFDDYNQFLEEADAVVAAMGLEGEIQVASFHPAYRFAGTAPNAMENYTNRSPYPMLHLLREASVTRAVETFPGVHEIGAQNAAKLNALGEDGWRRLWKRGRR